MEYVAVAVVALAAGLGLGFAARSMLASQTIKGSQEKAARIIAEARAQQKDLILEAKEDKIRLTREPRMRPAPAGPSWPPWSAACSSATSSWISARTCWSSAIASCLTASASWIVSVKTSPA